MSLKLLHLVQDMDMEMEMEIHDEKHEFTKLPYWHPSGGILAHQDRSLLTYFLQLIANYFASTTQQSQFYAFLR